MCLYIEHIPIAALKDIQIFFSLKAFVRISVSWSSIDTYSRDIVLSSTNSRDEMVTNINVLSSRVLNRILEIWIALELSMNRFIVDWDNS